MSFNRIIDKSFFKDSEAFGLQSEESDRGDPRNEGGIVIEGE